MDAADEIIAVAKEGVLALGHGDVDSPPGAVDGGRTKDEGFPGASCDGSFGCDTGEFARVTRSDGGVFVDPFGSPIDTCGGEIDDALSLLSEGLEEPGVRVVG